MRKKLSARFYMEQITDRLMNVCDNLEHLKPLLYEQGGTEMGDQICPMLNKAQELLQKVMELTYDDVDKKQLDDYLDNEYEALELES